jgi:hypothetical protein
LRTRRITLAVGLLVSASPAQAGLSIQYYRLRVENVRVFYDVTEKTVEILAIVPKDEADKWLEKAGEPHEDRSPE